MSLDINQFVRLVKRAALEAVRTSAPAGVEYGIVSSISPLEITVDQKKRLTNQQLVLTDAVRDYVVGADTPPEQQGGEKLKVHNALKAGEKVILLRCDGGQQYIVLGRWEART